MRVLALVAASCLLLAFVGDATARVCKRNKNFPLIEKGMTLEQVTGLIGKPVSAESGPEDSKVLFYCLASSFLDTDGSDTREYWVQLMQGKVIGYGERNDAAAMQRAQRQHASAWNGANMIVNSANQAADRISYGTQAPIATHVTVQQNVVIDQSGPLEEPTEASSDQARRDWRTWSPR